MKRTLLLGFIFGWALTALAANPTTTVKNKPPPAPQPNPNGSRFLFILDTSDSMKKIDPMTRQTLFDMIFNGLDGYMRTGDTFGLWTFGERVVAGDFPMQVWNAENSVEGASRATLFLKAQKYEGENQIEDLLLRVSSVMRAVSNVNVFLITDGDTPVRGTPFDQRINTAYEQKAKARKSAKKPFVTTLVVRDGQIANAYVTIAGEPINLPPRPAPKTVSAQASSTNTTNSVVARQTPSPAAILKSASPETPATPVPPNSAAQTPDPQASNSPPEEASSVERTAPSAPPESSSKSSERLSDAASEAHIAEQAGSLVSANPSSPVQPLAAPRKVMQIITRSNSVEARAPSPEKLAANTETNPVPVNPAFASTSSVTPPPPPMPPPAGATSVADSKTLEAAQATPVLSALTPPSSMVVAAQDDSLAPEAPKAIVRTTMVATPGASPASLGAMTTLAIGGILLALALFLLGVALRRMRPEPQGSLITQSMQRR